MRSPGHRDDLAAIAPDILRRPAVDAKVKAADKVKVIEELTRDESLGKWPRGCCAVRTRVQGGGRRLSGLRLGGVSPRNSGCRVGRRSCTLRGWVVRVPGGCRRGLCGMWRPCRSGAHSMHGCG
ncbi:DUF6192 family protein [Streptomyces sp. PanSC9]|uniref:DUF6192 family protein n=1 Tax=Streptomyces sp. PanSC9 TaxID=1520461 RepID=UPI0037D9FA02